MMNFAYGDKYAAFLHDAVMLYAIALNETIAKGLDYRSGVVVANQMSNRLFSGSWSRRVVDMECDIIIIIIIIIINMAKARCS